MGQIKIRHRTLILVENENISIKSYAALILLKRVLKAQDETIISKMEAVQKDIEFSRNYLERHKLMFGDIVCTYCSTPGLIIEYEYNRGTIPKDMMATIDHIIPKVEGIDAYYEENICPACSKCNGKKGRKSVEQFKETIKTSRQLC